MLLWFDTFELYDTLVDEIWLNLWGSQLVLNHEGQESSPNTATPRSASVFGNTM